MDKEIGIEFSEDADADYQEKDFSKMELPRNRYKLLLLLKIFYLPLKLIRLVLSCFYYLTLQIFN